MPDQRIDFPSINDVPDSDWENLSAKRIFFGHQSVGNNIMGGVYDILNDNSKINLKIMETFHKVDINSGIFAHYKIGYNKNPLSKIVSFSNYMKNGLGGTIDIAFLSFVM